MQRHGNDRLAGGRRGLDRRCYPAMPSMRRSQTMFISSRAVRGSSDRDT